MRAVREIEAAIEAARVGAAILLQHWEQFGKEDAHIKACNDWVSRADRESEKAIASFLHDLFPDDAILGEEGGMSVDGLTARTWITEPLDGKRVSTRRKRDRVA